MNSHERIAEARKLNGKRVRFHHQQDYAARRVKSISLDGMVTVEGLSGEFAPHLFVIVPGSGYSDTSSSFANAIGKLRTLELATRGWPVRLSDEVLA